MAAGQHISEPHVPDGRDIFRAPIPGCDANHPKYAAKTIFRAMNDANVSWTYYYKDGIFLAQFQDFFDPKIQPKTVQVSDQLSRLNGVCSGNPCDPDQALPQVIFIDSPSGGSGLDERCKLRWSI